MLDDPRAGRTRGRQAEASANDDRILTAAFNVLTSNPRASISAIAEQAGVGVASLYRRFASRDDLTRQLALYAMKAVEDAARTALSRVEEDPWDAFIYFITSAMGVGAGSMRALAGTFTAGEDLNAAGERLNNQMRELLTRTQQAGAVRADLTALDLLQLFEMLRAIRVDTNERSDRLRRRYIEMLTPALRAAATTPLSEPSPTWSEIIAVWNP